MVIHFLYDSLYKMELAKKFSLLIYRTNQAKDIINIGHNMLKKYKRKILLRDLTKIL